MRDELVPWELDPRNPRNPCQMLFAVSATGEPPWPPSYACGAQALSPGLYGAAGSKCPGYSTYRIALV